ncbi:MAG: LamG domain-containing protein, partial [Opitutaceae bacterium]
DAALTAYGVRSFANYYSTEWIISDNRFIGNAGKSLTAIVMSYMTGRKTIADNIAKDCGSFLLAGLSDHVLVSNNQVFDCTDGIVAGSGGNDDWSVQGNRIVVTGSALKVTHSGTHPSNQRWLVQNNFFDPCGYAYDAWDWRVGGNQVATGGTLDVTRGDPQRLTLYYNSGDAMAVDLNQGGRTMALGTLNLGLAGYTPDLWYKCDDNAADKVVADSAGGGANLTAWVNTSTRHVAGVIGTGALDFNGISDRAYRNTAAATGTSGSVTAWIYPAAFGTGIQIVTSADEASTTRYAGLYCDGDGKLIWNQRNADAADRVLGNDRMVAGEWHHVAAVSTGAAYSLYVDGQLQTLTVSSGANNGDWWDDATAKDNLVIGAFVTTSSSGFFSGYLDDVRVYSEVLTVAEVNYMATAQAETFTGAMTFNGQAVSLGANDSGGAGYRVLRVPNP